MTKTQLTVAGTDIEQVKRENSASGLTYNEVKALLANKKKAGVSRLFR
ncbi:MAG: hypothetical protein ACI4XL_11200 [Bacillus sp. (in: firmicutes)]